MNLWAYFQVCKHTPSCIYGSYSAHDYTGLHSESVTENQWLSHVVSSGRITVKELRAGAHGERGARACNGGLGAMPPVGSRGKAPGQGVRG